jgi:hypothetical protein
MTAVRTREPMFGTLTSTMTPRTILRSIPRAFLGLRYPQHLRLTGTGFADQSPLPGRQTAPKGFPLLPPATNLALPGLRYPFQPFPDKNCSLWNPSHQLAGGDTGKVEGAVSSFAAKLFQGTPYTSRVLPLCLTSRKLLLKSFSGLTSPLVKNLDIPAATEEFPVLAVNGRQGIDFTHVEADGVVEDTVLLPHFQTDGEPSDEPSVPLNHGQAVERNGVVEPLAEIFRKFESNLLPPLDSPDRQQAIALNLSIPTAAPDEEQGKRTAEVEGCLRRSFVASCRLVRGGDGADCTDRHLRRQRTLDAVIGDALKLDRVEVVAVVETDGRKGLPDSARCFKCFAEIGIIRKKNRQASLHCRHWRIIRSQVSGNNLGCRAFHVRRAAIPPSPKGDGPLAANLWRRAGLETIS